MATASMQKYLFDFCFPLDVKLIIIVGDGMADEPLGALQGQTPLEYAQTPHMDDVVRSGSIGQFYAIEPGVKVDSDAAHLAMLGQDVNTVFFKPWGV